MVFLGGVEPRLVLLSGAGLATTALAVAAISVVASVGARTRGRAASDAAGLVFAVGVSSLLATISAALAWSSLLSYEDVHSVVHSGAFPQFGATALQTVVGGRTVVGVWLAGTTALAAAAFSLTRAMCRDFDVEVGRPTRPRADAQRS
jgi:hypothetical protein